MIKTGISKRNGAATASAALSAPSLLSPPLVGREPERALLRGRLEEAQEGRGSVVVVLGEAGMGKTRLMAEVERQAGEQGMLFLRGAGNAAHAGLPYGLFAGVLAAFLQGASRLQRNALRRAIQELAPHLLGRLFPRARPGFAQSRLDPALGQTLFLARLARLLLGLERPAVLCLEDVHWADSASLRALRYLASRNADAPLAMVVTCRPEGKEPGLEGALQALRSASRFHEVRLKPLSAEETRALVSSCFASSGFGSELMGLLYRRSQGVPLLVVQYLELLRDQGVVYQRRGLWMDSALQMPELPGSLHAAVQGRVRKLSEEERQLLECAAVQGEQLAAEPLAHVLGWPLPRVLGLLKRLGLATGLVRPQAGEFCFAHFLLRSALYARLPEKQRRLAHLGLANWLEQHRPGEVELLAYHFYRGGELLGALPHLLEAARRAHQSFALWEAHAFLEQALEALAQVEEAQRRPRRLEVLLALIEVDERLGELERVVTLCGEVLNAAVPEEDGPAVGQALLKLGRVHHRKAEWEEAAKLYDQALQIFAELGQAHSCALVRVQQGNIALERSRLEEAEARFSQAKAAALESQDPVLLGAIYGNLGIAADMRGQRARAIAHYAEALRAHRKARHLYGIAQTCHNLGLTYAALQQWEKALAHYARGEKLARAMGTMDVVANILVSQAAAQIGMGDVEGAETSCRSAQVYYEQLQDRLGLAECKKVGGAICQERGEHEAAQALLLEARQVFQELENRLGVAECDRELGLVAQRRGDADAAGRYLRAAAALFARIGAAEEARKAEALLAIPHL